MTRTESPAAAVQQMLRQAIDADRLRRVLRLAGADEVLGEAPQALREAATDAVLRQLLEGAGAPPRRALPAGVDANTVEEARAATKKPYIELALHLAGSQSGTDAVRQALATEIVVLAHHAVTYARSEGRAVDANCVAVAAGRSAQSIPTDLVPTI